jgi:hypothetical protein
LLNAAINLNNQTNHGSLFTPQNNFFLSGGTTHTNSNEMRQLNTMESNQGLKGDSWGVDTTLNNLPVISWWSVLLVEET